MTIDEVRQQLSAYLDGELAEAPRREVEAALAAHPKLRAELAELRRVAQLVRAMPREAAPAGFRRRVAAALTGVAAARRHPARPSLLRRWRPALLAAAACLAVAAASIWINQSRGPRTGAHHVTDEGLGEPEAPAPESTAALREAVADRKAEEAGEKLAGADGYRASAPAAPKPSATAEEPKHGGASGGEAPPRKPATVEASPVPTEPKSAAKAVGGAGTPHLKMAKKAPAQPAILNGALHDSVAQTAAGQSSLEADDRLAERKRRANEAADLIAAIERPAAKQGGKHALSSAVAGPGAPTRAAEDRLRSVRLAYSDLRRCLADVRRALDAANVPYVIQPVGSGEFFVTTTLPVVGAPALVARVAGAARGGEGHAPLIGRTKAKSEAATPAGNGLSSVSLVLHFSRAEAQGGAAPADHPQQ